MSKKKKVPRYTDNLYNPFLDDNIHRFVFIFDVSNGKILCPSAGIVELADKLTVKEYSNLANVLYGFYMTMKDYIEVNV